MRLVVLALTSALLVVAGCAQPSSTPESSSSAKAKSLSFVNKVWQVKQSNGVQPGQLYTFLSDGTLVIASENGKPSLGAWTFVDSDSVLTTIEDGIPYQTDILALSDTMFSIRSHNPGQPVDIVLVPADHPPPGAISQSVTTQFSVPHAELGELSSKGETIQFRLCDGHARPSQVADLPNGEARTLIRDLGGGQAIPALVRLDGRDLREIRFAGPSGMPCARVLAAGEVQAKGNEPFWSAEVDGGQVVVKTPEQQGGVRYANGWWTHPNPTRWIFQATRQDNGHLGRLQLALTETPCFDSMSGARFPYQAVLDRDGVQMKGCALEGRKGIAR